MNGLEQTAESHALTLGELLDMGLWQALKQCSIAEIFVMSFIAIPFFVACNFFIYYAFVTFREEENSWRR